MRLCRYGRWVVVRTLKVSERSLYSMHSVILSQWRQRKIGVMSQDLGASTTARARVHQQHHQDYDIVYTCKLHVFNIHRHQVVHTVQMRKLHVCTHIITSLSSRSPRISLETDNYWHFCSHDTLPGANKTNRAHTFTVHCTHSVGLKSISNATGETDIVHL